MADFRMSHYWRKFLITFVITIDNTIYRSANYREYIADILFLILHVNAVYTRVAAKYIFNQPRIISVTVLGGNFGGARNRPVGYLPWRQRPAAREDRRLLQRGFG